MSVVSVVERHQEREFHIDEDGTRDYQRTFLVQTDNAEDGQLTVASAFGIPQRWQSYATGTESDVFATCRSIDAEPVDGTRILWIVKCGYSSRYDVSGQPKVENPLERPAVVRWGSATFQETVERGYLVSSAGVVETSLTAIKNSAGDKFSSAVEEDVARPVLQISKNFASFDQTLAYEYINSVNNDDWLGGTPRQWKCQQFGAQSVVEQVNDSPLLYWACELEFHFNYDTWDRQILDQGYVYISGGNRININDNNQQPLAEPVALDGSGGLLAVAGTQVFRRYATKRQKSFNDLGLF